MRDIQATTFLAIVGLLLFFSNGVLYAFSRLVIHAILCVFGLVAMGVSLLTHAQASWMQAGVYTREGELEFIR